jgi:hypothetical protein
MRPVRKWGIALTIAAVCVAGVLIAVNRVTAAQDRDKQDCLRQLQLDETAVRTGRDWTSEHIPGVGDYVDIHWQAEALGNPCSTAPGPTDWVYEGVLQLRDTDTPAFAAWPAAPPGLPPVRDALQAFVPAGVRWRHDGQFPQRVQKHNVDLYVDPDLAVAWFSIRD